MSWKPAKDEARQLKKAGYDGLYYPGECACLVDDLYPCGERQDGCLPGYKGDCSDACTHEGAGDGNWHVTPTKQVGGDGPEGPGMINWKMDTSTPPSLETADLLTALRSIADAAEQTWSLYWAEQIRARCNELDAALLRGEATQEPEK